MICDLGSVNYIILGLKLAFIVLGIFVLTVLYYQKKRQIFAEIKEIDKIYHCLVDKGNIFYLGVLFCYVQYILEY